VTDTLAGLSEAFSRAYIDQDLEAIAAAYTTDALVLAGQGPIVEGRDSIAAMFRMPDGVRLIYHRIVPRRVVVEDDMAWDVGVYEFQAVANGDTVPMRYGKYAVVWERDDTGTWRMAMDMWSPRPSPDDTTEPME
jgi:ketosteroid isomerase-like protein